MRLLRLNTQHIFAEYSAVFLSGYSPFESYVNLKPLAVARRSDMNLTQTTGLGVVTTGRSSLPQ